MSTFTVTEYYEMLALHRMLVEAKFNPSPEDLDIAASPLAGKLMEKLVGVLANAELERGHPDKKERWESWREIDKSGRFWKSAISYGVARPEWHDWSELEKSQFAENVLRPFLTNSQLVAEYISEVEAERKR